MDLWTTGLNSCTVASSASDLPQSISHMDITLAGSTSATTPPTVNFFDPWLNCDELDLGAIFHQANTTLHTGELPPSPSVMSLSESSDISTSRQQQQASNGQLQQTSQSKPTEQTTENGRQMAIQGNQMLCLDTGHQRQQHHDHQQRQQQQQQQQSNGGNRHLFCQNHNNISNGHHHNHRSTILPSDNKRHILSMINNCLPTSSLSPSLTPATFSSDTTNSQLNLQRNYNNNHNHDHRNNTSNLAASQCSTSNSIDSSPISTSLASSPINSLTSNYSSLSPHSPYSHQHNKAMVLINQTNKEETEFASANQASLLLNQHQQQQQLANYCFTSDYCATGEGAPLTQHSHQLIFAGICGDEVGRQQGQLQQEKAASYNETSQTIVGSSSQQQASEGKTNSKTLANRQYKSAEATIASGSRQSSLFNGSGLAPHQQQQKQQQQRQKQTKQAVKKPISSGGNGSTSTKSAGNGTTDTGNDTGEKLVKRRCRHFTNYVLGEEEKRLLLREGHTDFPMNCAARPLTKAEERILRKIRRKIRNKKSAQCSRQRKKEYVEDLERKYSDAISENHELKLLIAKMQEQPPQQQLQHQGYHFATFSDDACVEGQSSNESIDMNWKGIFQRPTAAATTTTTTTTMTAGQLHHHQQQQQQQQQQVGNIIYS